MATRSCFSNRRRPTNPSNSPRKSLIILSACRQWISRRNWLQCGLSNILRLLCKRYSGLVTKPWSICWTNTATRHLTRNIVVIHIHRQDYRNSNLDVSNSERDMGYGVCGRIIRHFGNGNCNAKQKIARETLYNVQHNCSDASFLMGIRTWWESTWK